MAEEQTRKKWEDMDRDERQDAMKAYHQLLRADFGRPPKNAFGQPMSSAQEWVNAEGPLATSQVQSEQLQRDQNRQEDTRRAVEKSENERKERDLRALQATRERDEGKKQEEERFWDNQKRRAQGAQSKMEENIKDKLNTVLAIITKSDLIAQEEGRGVMAWPERRRRESLQTRLADLNSRLISIPPPPDRPEVSVNNLPELGQLESDVDQLKREANNMLIQQQNKIQEGPDGDEVLAQILQRVQVSPTSQALASRLSSRGGARKKTIRGRRGGKKTHRGGRKKTIRARRGGTCRGVRRGGRKKTIRARRGGARRSGRTRRRGGRRGGTRRGGTRRR